MNRMLTFLALGAFLSTATASLGAATPRQQCRVGLARAQEKYQSCVQKWLVKRYGPLHCEWDCEAHERGSMARCRVRYGKAWDQLVALNTAPCVGSRFVDNGDETVTDNLTGLTWEKKTNGDEIPNWSDPHDADNFYGMTALEDGDGTDEDGTVFTDFLATLNAGEGFGGANGWRVPTLAELESIQLPESYPCATSPCIDTDLFGPIGSVWDWYSSATGDTGDVVDAGFVWSVNPESGIAKSFLKSDRRRVRAVRGGR